MSRNYIEYFLYKDWDYLHVDWFMYTFRVKRFNYVYIINLFHGKIIVLKL